MSLDEFEDNDNFPRQIYVREGRRIRGEYLFTAHDALSKRHTPEHATSITASHYALDSHACLKREPKDARTLDGIFSYRTTPYSVPYGVLVPLEVENLLIPAPASSTHIGFSTLRMEPCWMALGEAAGEAINVSLDDGTTVRDINVLELQRRLLNAGVVLSLLRATRRRAMTTMRRCNSLPFVASWKIATKPNLTSRCRSTTARSGRLGRTRPTWPTLAGRAVNNWIESMLKSANERMRKRPRFTRMWRSRKWNLSKSRRSRNDSLMKKGT